MSNCCTIKSLLSLIFLISNVTAWDNNDLELFDLVEDVNENFYKFLGVQKDASTKEIRREYHKLSLLLHPDKNKEQGSEKKFRQLVGIYEVLKDEEKRQKYNQILEKGLPDWRQPVFYYRHVRKLGLLELTILIFSIATVGHYLFAWAVYWERKYTLEENRGSKLRKMEKKLKKHKQLEIAEDRAIIEEEIRKIPKPRLLDMLPFQLVKASFQTVLSAPTAFAYIKHQVTHLIEMRKSRENDDNSLPTEDVKRPPRKKAYENQEDFYSAGNTWSTEEPIYHQRKEVEEIPETLTVKESSTEWSRDDLSALAKAVKKFPSGTFERWEKIANSLNRSTNDVCATVKRLRDTSLSSTNSYQHALKASQNAHSSNISKESSAEMVPDQGYSENSYVNSVHPEGEKIEDAPVQQTKDESWTQVQQKALEIALKEIPKGTDERWDRIAEFVKTKTKDECMQRYKYLVGIVRKKTVPMKLGEPA